jgi:hypothetical protein
VRECVLRCVAYPLNTSPNEPFPILSSLVKSLSGSTSASKRNKEAMAAACKNVSCHHPQVCTERVCGVEGGGEGAS